MSLPGMSLPGMPAPDMSAVSAPLDTARMATITTASALLKFIQDTPRALSVDEFRKVLSQLSESERGDFDKLVESAEAANAKLEEGKKKTSNEEVIKRAIVVAGKMWIDVKRFNRDEKFAKYSDKDKVAAVENLSPEYADFIKTYPIVAKYMIAGGRYSKDAFRKFVDRLINYKYLPKNEQPQGYMHDQWLRRQADYIRFMWCDYNRRRHVQPAEHQKIWEEAYASFKGEFDKMQKLQTEAEELVAAEKKARSHELLGELSKKLTEPTETVANVDAARDKLLAILRKKVAEKEAQMAAEAAAAQAAAQAASASVSASGAAADAPLASIQESIAAYPNAAAAAAAGLAEMEAGAANAGAAKAV
jgi:hypothetical protein